MKTIMGCLAVALVLTLGLLSLQARNERADREGVDGVVCSMRGYADGSDAFARCVRAGG